MIEPDRNCTRCSAPFAADPEIDRRLKERGSTGVKVCPACVLYAIDEMAAESVLHMTDEEIEQELREDGVDVEAFAERTRKLIADAMAKAKEQP